MWETQGRKIFTVRVLLRVDLARGITRVSENRRVRLCLCVGRVSSVVPRNIEVNRRPLDQITL